MRRVLFTLAVGLPLTGCAATPHSIPDASRYPEGYLAESAVTTRSGPFWSQFADPVLNELLTAAQNANGDVRSAAARLGQARAVLAGYRAATRPEVGWSAQAQRRGTSEETTTFTGPREGSLFDATFDARWELDLFGRLNQEAQAGAYDVDAAALDAEAIRISVMAETGRLYFAVRSLQLRIEVVRRAAAGQVELAALARSRASAGLISEIDAMQADALAASSQARVADLRAQLADNLAALALVVGRTAGEMQQVVSSTPILPDGASPLIGSPADLLEDRYDVRREIALLAAADARSAARVRDRLPRLTLSATAGASAVSTGSLFTPEAGVFSVAGALVAPVFDFGRRKADTEQARAVADERSVILETTVLTAIREIERDAATVTELEIRLEHVATEASRNRTAEQLLRARYLAGLESLSRVIDAEREALASAERELTVREAKLASILSLWKSLGGAK